MWDDLSRRWSTREAERLHARLARRAALAAIWARVPREAKWALYGIAAIALIGWWVG